MNKKELGDFGEERAARLLEQEGYRILERNFRCRTGEVDVVARMKDWIVFVEVKTRRSLIYGLPCEAVTEEKKRRLRRAAAFYMRSRRLECCAMRIDVVELIYQNGGWYCRHLINAV